MLSGKSPSPRSPRAPNQCTRCLSCFPDPVALLLPRAACVWPGDSLRPRSTWARPGAPKRPLLLRAHVVPLGWVGLILAVQNHFHLATCLLPAPLPATVPASLPQGSPRTYSMNHVPTCSALGPAHNKRPRRDPSVTRTLTFPALRKTTTVRCVGASSTGTGVLTFLIGEGVWSTCMDSTLLNEQWDTFSGPGARQQRDSAN